MFKRRRGGDPGEGGGSREQLRIRVLVLMTRADDDGGSMFKEERKEGEGREIYELEVNEGR